MEAVVQFDYAAREPDELTLKKGDLITDVRPMPDGWMEGLKEGKKGMFPDNYVKIVHNSSGVVLRKKNPRKCKVLFSYKPANRDELELNIDDVIEVLGEVEEGWWKGELRNEVGVFPSNYVTEITDSKNVSRSDSKTSTGSLKKEDSIKKEKNAVESAKIADNVETNAPVLPPKPVKEVCVALFPYEAVNSDELTLAEGDIVTILSREVEDKGWWKGELKGKVGVFPDNFVQLLNQDELVPKSEKSATSPRSGTTASLRKVFQSQMENKSLGPVVSKKPALPPPPPTTKKPPAAKTSTTSLSKTLSGIKSMLSSDQNAAEKIKHVGAEMGDSKQYGSIAVKRSESVGSMKKTSDSPDGSCMSRSSYNVTPLSIPESSPLLVPTNHDNQNAEPKSPDFDQIERTAMLSHPTASRAKAPRRRPPSAAFSVPIEDNSVLDPPPTNGIPGVDREKAPWVQELKMNQAKKSTTNSVIGGGRTRVMISPSTTTITSESSETTVTSWSGLTSVGVGGVVFKPPGYALPLTTPEPVTVSTPTSPVAFVSSDFSPTTPSVERSQIAVLNEKVKQLESAVQQQNALIDKLSSKLDVEMGKRIEMEKEIKKIMELVTRV